MQPPAMAQRGRKHEQATGTVTEREWATRSEGRKGTTEGDKGRKQKMWKKKTENGTGNTIPKSF